MTDPDPRRSIELASTPDPGRIAAFTVGELRVAVANVDGRLFAFQDTCTHEACSLGDEGELEGHRVICGCHGGAFDVRTGEPLDGPVFDPLEIYRVSEAGGRARVELADTPPPSG
jgi:nitrite reductase/ring-hydroxylating ferredoxin subunit